jgi:hypothetical protein
MHRKIPICPSVSRTQKIRGRSKFELQSHFYSERRIVSMCLTLPY